MRDKRNKNYSAGNQFSAFLSWGDKKIIYLCDNYLKHIDYAYQ